MLKHTLHSCPNGNDWVLYCTMYNDNQNKLFRVLEYPKVFSNLRCIKMEMKKIDVAKDANWHPVEHVDISHFKEDPGVIKN